MTDKTTPVEGFDLVDTLANILIAARTILEEEPAASGPALMADQILDDLVDVTVYVAQKENIDLDDLVETVIDRATAILESPDGEKLH